MEGLLFVLSDSVFRVPELVVPSLAIGQRLSHYLVEAIAGTGGMGVVYRARDTRPKLDRIVALKVLPPELRDDPDFLQRF